MIQNVPPYPMYVHVMTRKIIFPSANHIFRIVAYINMILSSCPYIFIIAFLDAKLHYQTCNLKFILIFFTDLTARLSWINWENLGVNPNRRSVLTTLALTAENMNN